MKGLGGFFQIRGLVERKISAVQGAQIGQKIHPVQMDLILAGIHIVAEGLVHGLAGNVKIHPFDGLRLGGGGRVLFAEKTADHRAGPGGHSLAGGGAG